MNHNIQSMCSLLKQGETVSLMVDGQDVSVINKGGELFFVPSEPPLSFFSTPTGYLSFVRGKECSFALAFMNDEELKRAYMVLGFPLKDFIRLFSPEIHWKES